MTSNIPPMSKDHFKDGLKYLIVEAKSPDGGEHPLRYRALGLLLLTGILDSNASDVRFALDHGCDVNMLMTTGMENILTEMGWQLPTNPVFSGAPGPQQVESPVLEETFPNG